MFNTANPPVAPMKNVVGNTHAETKAEIEARKRAQLAAEQAMLAAQNAKREERKSPWPAILVLIFGVIAIAGAGFAVYEHTENEKLQKQLLEVNASLSTSLNLSESLQKELTDLKLEYEALKAKLPPEELPENSETPASDTPDSKTPAPAN